MNDRQKAVIEELRNQGYAVSTWTPEEMGACTTPEDMEEQLARHGSELIDYNRMGI